MSRLAQLVIGMLLALAVAAASTFFLGIEWSGAEVALLAFVYALMFRVDELERR